MPETDIDTLSTDFRRLQLQKSRKTGGIEGRVLLNVAFVEGEQYTNYANQALYIEPQDANKLYLTFNVTGRRFAKLLGRLSAIDPPYKAQPDKKDPKALAEAEIVDVLDRALDQKLDQQSKLWELLYWLGVGGTGFVYTPWVPNATTEPAPVYSENGELTFTNTLTGEQIPQSQKDQLVQAGAADETFELLEEAQPQGEVGCEVFGPLNVFVDQSVRSLDDLSPDQRVYIARIRTAGWIEENFGIKVDRTDELSIVTSRFQQNGDSTGGIFLKDLIPLVQGSPSDDDPDMAVVVEAFTPASTKYPRGQYTIFIPGDQVLYDGPNPYEEIPIVDFHWKPVTTTFWTGDYISDLIAPQRFLNKRISQLGEQSNASLYSQLLLGGSLKMSDIAADRPGGVEGGLAENGQPMVARLGPPEIPVWFMNSLEMVLRLLNDIAGGMDLTENQKFPGQLRGPMAVPLLQEIIDTEWGPFFKHIGIRMAKVKNQRINRVKQFYPPVRTLHYTARDQKDEVMTFYTNKVLKSGTNYNITIERGAILPELRALREARVRERLASPLAILYMDERTGRPDKSKIAQDLQFGDLGRESREAQFRKLGQEVVAMLWRGQPIPPVQPFYDHSVMLDELEASMSTTEYFHASQQIQQAFAERWQQHSTFLQQQAQMQQQAMQAGLVQNAVAQAAQQAAAQAAADAVENARIQVTQTQDMVQSGQTADLYRAAQQNAYGNHAQASTPGGQQAANQSQFQNQPQQRRPQ